MGIGPYEYWNWWCGCKKWEGYGIIPERRALHMDEKKDRSWIVAAMLLAVAVAAIVAVVALYWLFTTPIEWGVNV